MRVIKLLWKVIKYPIKCWKGESIEATKNIFYDFMDLISSDDKTIVRFLSLQEVIDFLAVKKDILVRLNDDSDFVLIKDIKNEFDHNDIPFMEWIVVKNNKLDSDLMKFNAVDCFEWL